MHDNTSDRAVTALYRLSSSIRSRSPHETLEIAKKMAVPLGISRVTDITRLDVLGIPVYASIRPNAVRGSLCVNAGKGIRNIEAEVGAYMEAIEFAVAEYGASHVKNHILNARSVLDGHERDTAVLDFCPVLGTEIDLDEPLGCVEAINIITGEVVFVPSELVFLPCPPEVSKGCYFGSNSNGLASGNTLSEATLHGLLEVIERDIRSFQSVKDESLLVDNTTLPDHLRLMLQEIQQHDMSLCVRYMDNIYGLPYFMAILYEINNCNPIYISGGYGCHLSKDIAVTRAICEAAQSRLSFIHGGRDDLIDRYARFSNDSHMDKEAYWQRLVDIVSDGTGMIDFDAIEDQSHHMKDIDSSIAKLTNMLGSVGNPGVYRVVYTDKEEKMQVVRILVPTLEFFNETTARVGARLGNYVQSM